MGVSLSALGVASWEWPHGSGLMGVASWEWTSGCLSGFMGVALSGFIGVHARMVIARSGLVGVAAGVISWEWPCGSCLRCGLMGVGVVYASPPPGWISRGLTRQLL